MSALTKERNTPRLGQDIAPYAFPIAADTKVFKGSIVCLHGTTKQLVPGAATATLICVGRASDTYDNTGGAAAAFNCSVDSGVFRFGNSAAADLIASTEVGADCYIVDDQTVAKTSATSTRPVAGKIVAVDASGVWVAMKFVS